ncbi:hypothetical protein BV510_16025, partial [Mycolicibacterium diernhoferi]
AKTRDLTDKPFGVNLTILPSINPPPYDEYRQVIVDSGIKIVESHQACGARPVFVHTVPRRSKANICSTASAIRGP